MTYVTRFVGALAQTDYGAASGATNEAMGPPVSTAPAAGLFTTFIARAPPQSKEADFATFTFKPV